MRNRNFFVRVTVIALVTAAALAAGWYRWTAEPDRPQHVPALARQSEEEPIHAMASSRTTADIAPDLKNPEIISEPHDVPSFSEETTEGRSKKQATLSLIHYPWQSLGYDIVFLGPRPGYRAMTISDRRRIEVYARPGDKPEVLAYDVAHELGHAFDLQYNTPERRAEWRRLRGIDTTVPWFGCNRCPDYQTPAGDFAETFAYLLLGPGNYHSRIAHEPVDPDEFSALSRFCRLTVDPEADPVTSTARQ